MKRYQLCEQVERIRLARMSKRRAKKCWAWMQAAGYVESLYSHCWIAPAPQSGLSILARANEAWEAKRDAEFHAAVKPALEAMIARMVEWEKELDKEEGL